jgi:hypothetical protein
VGDSFPDFMMNAYIIMMNAYSWVSSGVRGRGEDGWRDGVRDVA